jgi:alginate O-acetyltransferase complex protein AlgI
MENFKQPYFATTIRDFWRRWHISLSTWLRDYLYIPLGGSRMGPRRTQINLLITMLLGGLWHGASWNFVIWGGLQGIFLIASHLTIDARDRISAAIGIPVWLRDLGRMIITFHLVCLSWVFFRANTLGDALEILGQMARVDFSKPFMQPTVFVYGGLGVLILLLVELLQTMRGSGREVLARSNWSVRWACWYAMLFLITLMGVQGDAQFIYFQF